MIICIKLFYSFFKVGLFCFGGGFTMLPMIYQEISRFGFMPAKEFSDLVALSQITPGPIAINAAAYVGFRAAGFTGATVATTAVILPSFIVILLVIAFLKKFNTSTAIKGILEGIRPATVGMIAAAVVLFAGTSVYDGSLPFMQIAADPLKALHPHALAICAGTFICAAVFKIGPIPLTIIAGIVGAIIS